MTIELITQHQAGGFIANLFVPSGSTKGDDNRGVSRLVRSRYIMETAAGLLAAGAHQEVRRVLGYLQATQRWDGHWPRRMSLDGFSCWSRIQMDDTALAILLVDLARREKALAEADLARLWPMVRKAAGYLVRNGPVAPEDRWEDDPGYSPSTVAAEIAALLAAADLADFSQVSVIATYLRETADVWNASIERWMSGSGADGYRKLDIHGSDSRAEGAPRNRTSMHVKTASDTEDISLSIHRMSRDAKALARFGLRDANDARIYTSKKRDCGLDFGPPLGSAPLVWAHAEYLKLRRSLSDGRVFDLPPQTVRRYLTEKTVSPLIVWRFNHKIRSMPVNKTMRIETIEPAVIHWSADNWTTVRDATTHDVGLGMHIVDLDTTSLPEGEQVTFTFYWPEADRWECENFSVQVGSWRANGLAPAGRNNHL